MKRSLALLLAVVLWAGIAPTSHKLVPLSFPGSATVHAQQGGMGPGPGTPRAASCSTFPCNAVLDNFNRADTGTLGSNWTVGTRPTWNIDLPITGNKAGGGGSTTSDYWNVTTYGNGEVYVTVSGTGLSQMVLWRMANLNSASFTGYELTIGGTGLQVYRWDDSSTATQLGADFTQTISAGDSFGVWHSGSTITVYYCASGGACGVSGAGWTSLGTRTDGTFSTGYIGIKGGDFFDDFGGGAR